MFSVISLFTVQFAECLLCQQLSIGLQIEVKQKRHLAVANMHHITVLPVEYPHLFIDITKYNHSINEQKYNMISNGWLKKGKSLLNIANQFTENMFTK